MSSTNLTYADLGGANLVGASPYAAKMGILNAENMKIDRKFKEIIDRSVLGYSTIEWVDNSSTYWKEMNEDDEFFYL